MSHIYYPLYMVDLFVYGSLQLPQVLEITLGYIPAMTSACAIGWQVCQLSHASYPGLIPHQAYSAHGIILHNISDADMCALDDFEGDEYVRSTINVHTVTDNTLTVQAYVSSPHIAHLITENPWTLSYLSGKALREFIHECHQWRADYQLKQ